MAQNSTGVTSSRCYGRDRDQTSVVSSRSVDIVECEANEAVRQRELEEARGRAAQMEKTMRWWSDCTANWREKWSKVRVERNKAREECKQLRSKLDTVCQESDTHKRDKDELTAQNEHLKREFEKIHILLLKHSDSFDGQILDVFNKEMASNKTHCNNETGRSVVSDYNENAQNHFEEYHIPGADLELSSNDEKSISKSNDESVLQIPSLQRLHINDNSQRLQIDNGEITKLKHTIETLATELQESKYKYQQFKEAREDLCNEMLNLQQQHQEEVNQLKRDIHDEGNVKDRMNQVLTEQRAEMERLQMENREEWAKREHIETEKFALERENKRIRAELNDLQERLDNCRKQSSPVENNNSDIKQFQLELNEKNREISEFHHSQSKLKKIIQDKMTELAHTLRRSEQYESEVKMLRNRVADLKKQLSNSESELDLMSNTVKRLQRLNEELQAQIDNFHMQYQDMVFDDDGKEDGGEEMAELDENEVE